MPTPEASTYPPLAPPAAGAGGHLPPGLAAHNTGVFGSLTPEASALVSSQLEDLYRMGGLPMPATHADPSDEDDPLVLDDTPSYVPHDLALFGVDGLDGATEESSPSGSVDEGSGEPLGHDEDIPGLLTAAPKNVRARIVRHAQTLTPP
jgi:hypothetical protein